MNNANIDIFVWFLYYSICISQVIGLIRDTSFFALGNAVPHFYGSLNQVLKR